MPSDALDFSRRAYLSELMDEPSSYAEFRDCLRDLEVLNRTVFAYRPTLRWLERIERNGDRPLHIVDVGCGGGDMLRRIEAWAGARRLALKLTGIDLNSHAARAAREFTSSGSSIEWVTGDIYSYKPAAPVGVVISSQFTHHLGDAELVDFLRWMERVAQRGWFINDLHRKIAPYYGIKALAWAMRYHRFIQHDAPVSIRRSFLRGDWERYCATAGLNGSDVSIEEFRPGRLCVSRVKR
ncbi:MAG TPA: methyltransferase domain-containing protein [Silvibacterium sp.]|nr:methyltransferase domain-containing protein [Silvibacterium sp.]